MVLNQLEPTNSAQPKDPESIIPISLDDFKEVEVWNAVKMMKSIKPPGSDGILTKMLKAGSDQATGYARSATRCRHWELFPSTGRMKLSPVSQRKGILQSVTIGQG